MAGSIIRDLPEEIAILLTAKFKKDFESDTENFNKTALTLGFPVNNIIYAHQRHTDKILIYNEKSADSGIFTRPLPGGFIYDAMITSVPGILLSVRTADCVPILLWDKSGRAVGTAHCGWRGTLDGLQAKTVRKMQETYGIKPDDLRAVLGSCIGECCYEVSPDFRQNFINALGSEAEKHFTPAGQKYLCDLAGINIMLLKNAGIKPENIQPPPHCTCCSENYFSHRRQGEARNGTHISFIGIRN
jgi:hypothetical protein